MARRAVVLVAAGHAAVLAAAGAPPHVDVWHGFGAAQRSAFVRGYWQKRPLLIRGMKWDMRLYVAIPSMRPLKLFLYQEGLVRFSTQAYDKSKLNNQFSHLTNSSINKYAHGGTEGAFHDNKWTLEQLKSYCQSSGHSYDKIWLQIEKIVILTCIHLCMVCPATENCFELLGFDVMLDQKLKPWLIEVNSSPAMAMDGAAD